MAQGLKEQESSFVDVNKVEQPVEDVITDKKAISGKTSEQMKAEKKKKRKSMLIKIAIFLVLLGISVATASVNLWDELRDFMLKFVDIATA